MFIHKGRSLGKYQSENGKLRPPLMRKPRAINRMYFYCPKLLTANDEIPQGSEVELVKLPEVEHDPFVMIQYDNQKFRVMWNDLRL